MEPALKLKYNTPIYQIEETLPVFGDTVGIPCMPKKIAGDLTLRLHRPEKLDPKPVYCALFRLPEEFFYAPQTLTAKEKALRRPEK